MLENNQEAENLERRVFLLSVSKRYWGWFGAIALAERLFEAKRLAGESGHFSLCETYYRAAVMAKERLEAARWPTKALWERRRNYAAGKMLELSDAYASGKGLPYMDEENLSIRAAILFFHGRFEESLECRELEISSSMHDPCVMILSTLKKADTLVELGRFEDAEKTYSTLEWMLSGPVSSIAEMLAVDFFLSKANCHMRKGERAKSIAAFEEALRLSKRTNMEERAKEIRIALAKARNMD